MLIGHEPVLAQRLFSGALAVLAIHGGLHMSTRREGLDESLGMWPEVLELRRELSEVPRDRARRCRYSPALRARVAQCVMERRASGVRVPDLAQALGLADNQLYKWMKAVNQASFRPVQVVSGERAGASVAVDRNREGAPLPLSTLSLVSPGGWRIEGLSLWEVRQLLPELP